uniref:Uncharacterized protein n=1 Tax=Anguilla anguilla TaxID=7936 RepID=A0A0E9VD84_ANGAN
MWNTEIALVIMYCVTKGQRMSSTLNSDVEN